MIGPLARSLGPLGASRRVTARSAVFASGGQILTASGAFDYERTQAWSVSFWLAPTATGGPVLIGKMLSSGTFRGWGAFYRGTAVVSPTESLQVLIRSDNGTGNLIQVAAPDGALAGSGLRHIVVTYDGSSLNTGIEAYVDGAAQALTRFGTLSATILNAATFGIGGRDGVGGSPGAMDNAGVWTRVLTSGEASQLRNAGRGFRYADLDAGLRSGLVSWWDLDEFSDGTGAVTRADAHGSNHLTDTGNVASGPPLAL